MDQAYTALEQRVATLEQVVETLTKAMRMRTDPVKQDQPKAQTPAHNMPVDLSVELTKRGIEHTDQDVQHIAKILSHYKLSTADIVRTLDKIATANNRNPIRNLPAYCNNTFRYEHADKAVSTP